MEISLCLYELLLDNTSVRIVIKISTKGLAWLHLNEHHVIEQRKIMNSLSKHMQ